MFRCASLGEPSTDAVIRTPLRSTAATCDQPASFVCPVLAPTSGSFPISPSVDVSVLPPAIVAVDLVDHVRMNGLRSAAASSVVTSRALETWPALVEPVRVLEVRRA